MCTWEERQVKLLKRLPRLAGAGGPGGFSTWVLCVPPWVVKARADCRKWAAGGQ